MIDIHCHLLPFTDDGPKSWEETYAMCEAAYADGIRHIVPTPHCDRRYRFERKSGEEKIQHLRERYPDLKFSLGCEFTLSYDNLDRAVQNPKGFTLGSTNYILVEPSEILRPNQNEEGLHELRGLGLIPVLAHPERNTFLRNQVELLEEWTEAGCLSAITGNSLTGFWGQEIRQRAEMMLKRGLVHCIVSDGHDPVRRPLVLSAGVAAAAKIVGEEAARALAVDNPGRIVDGLPL